ncbi:MAG: DUF4386 domain-containing protein, partial [Gammaproteobacteria bacterium]|nr:DUF4386 domain-containing protein [Gammaproteobacteria bacterium]
MQKQLIARWTGAAMLTTLVTGILVSVFVADGIDINLSADIVATAQNMLDAEIRLRGKAYFMALMFALDALIMVGFFLLLREHGTFLASWALVVNVGASLLMLLGAVYALNAAEIAGNEAFDQLGSDAQRLMLAGMQATADYTSFHLGLVVSSAAKALFYYLFLRSRLIPPILSAWGVFASLFVGGTVVARDFIPVLG